MSAAGARKQPNDWRGAPPDYSLYAPNPHPAEDYFALLTPTQEKIIRYLMSVGKRQENDIWVCGQHSWTSIGRAVRLHWTTVKRNVEALIQKQSLDRREVWSRNKKGGRRMGTLYSIPAFGDALERRRALPGVAVTANGALLYVGRFRTPMTMEAALKWGINLAKVPPSSAAPRRTVLPASQKEGAAVQTVNDEAMQPNPPPPGKPEPLPREILAAFRSCVQQKLFDKAIAVKLILSARKIGVERGELLSDQDIVDAIYAGWENAKRKVQSIAFYNAALPEKVRAILEDRADRREAVTANAGACPYCNGAGIIARVINGVGVNERCVCQREERAAG
jgi:hypothetical protein